MVVFRKEPARMLHVPVDGVGQHDTGFENVDCEFGVRRFNVEVEDRNAGLQKYS